MAYSTSFGGGQSQAVLTLHQPFGKLPLMRSLFAIVILVLIGCGPIRSSSAISTTQSLLSDAEKDGASKYARYQYFKAVALLNEAKIREGYGEFEAAANYAEEAEALARQSRLTAKSRRDLELRRVRGKVLQHKLGRKVLERIQKDRLKQQAEDNADTKTGTQVQSKKKKVRKTTKSGAKIKRRTFRPPSMDNPNSGEESR
ncbi:MAG TPA: DUF4398 domain-containing protein [Myxococcales bacterium]|nr:DUF4398 domain-containing protein [Myxococcales bacterium]